MPDIWASKLLAPNEHPDFFGVYLYISCFWRKEILSDMKEAKEGEKEGKEGDETEEEKAEKKKAETGAAPGEDGADFVQVNLCYFSAQNFYCSADAY